MHSAITKNALEDKTKKCSVTNTATFVWTFRSAKGLRRARIKPMMLSMRPIWWNPELFWSLCNNLHNKKKCIYKYKKGQRKKKGDFYKPCACRAQKKKVRIQHEKPQQAIGELCTDMHDLCDNHNGRSRRLCVYILWLRLPVTLGYSEGWRCSRGSHQLSRWCAAKDLVG